MTQTRLIGIAGASGSGKTHLAETLLERLGPDTAVVIQEDAYYRDLSHMPLEQRARVNFDHPGAFDHDLLAAHMQHMLHGHTVSCPVYDYKTHTRLNDTRPVMPRRVILLEGILVLNTARLRKLMDLRVFVDTALEVCCERRLQRDMAERARTRESVIRQFNETVRPMYLEHIEPSRQYADLLIPGEGEHTEPVNRLIARINALNTRG
ncbi:MAG: uridine kinase [Phycisphaerae bacterium]|nr:uridine kinase [Phycisphaerae bacterium]